MTRGPVITGTATPKRSHSTAGEGQEEEEEEEREEEEEDLKKMRNFDIL